MITHIIGVDCAVKDENMGLALARWTGSGARVLALEPGLKEPGSCARVMADWLRHYPRCLLAFDSPLGWPQPLAAHLAKHRAGEPLKPEADRLFRRETDRFIRARHGKQTLDVGADRIARTAVAALNLLQQVRDASGLSIPLAWDASPGSASAIEVYPGGTLRACGIWEAGYRKPEHREIRQRMLDRLSQELIFECPTAAALASVDVLDAIVCVLAGVDFLSGRAEAPTDPILAQQEGWTWLRSPMASDD